MDYSDDTAFWYNLPANFDLVDTCFKMSVWTGDRTYINDPVFLNFYDHTVNDYVKRWDLGVDKVMTRQRLMNVVGAIDPKKKHQKSRGLPSYNETDSTYIVGFDTLVTERAALRDDAYIQELRNNDSLAEDLLTRAAAVENLLTTTWWDKTNNTYFQRLNKNYQLEGGAGTSQKLSDDWHLDVASNAGGFTRPVDFDASMARLLRLRGGNLQYAEVSYSRIGDIVRDAFGVDVIFNPPMERGGSWVETSVQTMSGLGTTVDWAELRNLPVRSNLLTVRHDGMTKTTLTNQTGPALIWFAKFVGSYPKAIVNGRSFNTKITQDEYGRDITTVRVIMGAGDKVAVQVGPTTNPTTAPAN